MAIRGRCSPPMSTPISRRRSSTRFTRPEGRRRDRFVRRPGRARRRQSVSPAFRRRVRAAAADNATAISPKVVQRFPVRIAIAPDALAREPLRAGLSVVADHPHPRRKPAAPLAARIVRPGRQGRRSGDASERRRRDSRAGPTRRPAGGAAFRTQAAVRLRLHGVRDVHGDPGHPDRLGVAAADPAGLSASSDEVTWVQTPI